MTLSNAVHTERVLPKEFYKTIPKEFDRHDRREYSNEMKTPPKRNLTEWEKAECAALKAQIGALNAARQKHERITQEAAGEALGMTQGAFSNYLNGRLALNADIAKGIFKVFGIAADSYSERLAVEMAEIAAASGRSELERVFDQIPGGHEAADEYLSNLEDETTDWFSMDEKPRKPETRVLHARNIPKITPKTIGRHEISLGIDNEQHANVAAAIGPYRTQRQYPVISWVAAGSWAESCDNFHPGDADEWMESDRNAGAHGYWLEVKGRSMEPTFPAGEMILIQPEGFDLTSGKFYIAKLIDTGESTFKQYMRDAGTEFLQPLNPSFPVPESLTTWR